MAKMPEPLSRNERLNLIANAIRDAWGWVPVVERYELAKLVDGHIAVNRAMEAQAGRDGPAR